VMTQQMGGERNRKRRDEEDRGKGEESEGNNAPALLQVVEVGN